MKTTEYPEISELREANLELVKKIQSQCIRLIAENRALRADLELIRYNTQLSEPKKLSQLISALGFKILIPPGGLNKLSRTISREIKAGRLPHSVRVKSNSHNYVYFHSSELIQFIARWVVSLQLGATVKNLNP